ncbi:sialidase family protein [Paenibacillus cymbidii]|uniref:sialidase family protein n=1 Tax=Paenibacillus cymbidii TaxID=1639034 RepID=UPI0010812664|nr:sialidase family protein [Paenibacillus cymbidii]
MQTNASLYETKRTISDAGASGGRRRYYAFPSLLASGEAEVLVAFKDGEAHMADASAPLELLSIDPATGQVRSRRTVDRTPGRNNQNPELMRMPDGTIMLYVDIQRSGRKERTGLWTYASSDGGATFRDRGPFPQAGGYEYGYSFDDATDDEGRVTMLVMSFAELAGGVRAVHALRTADNGATWTHVRNLNDEFGFDFNESTLLPYADGYLLVARGYDRSTRAYRTDREFRVQAASNWSERCEAIDYVGRPKLFERDGRYYVLCRNIAAGNNHGDLQLYEIDPERLLPVANALLDTNDGAPGESYYAEGYFCAADDGRTRWAVVTYAPPVAGETPDIVWLAFDWEKLLRRLQENRYRY